MKLNNKHENTNGLGIFLSNIDNKLNQISFVESLMIEALKLSNEYCIQGSIFHYNGIQINECIKGFYKELVSSEDINELKESLLNASHPAIRIYEMNDKIEYTAVDLLDDKTALNECDENIKRI